MTGRLYLVGVGPGDPELLTLKGARLLGAVPVVAHPVTGDGQAFAGDIAGRHINPAAEVLPIRLPMHPDPAPAQAAYDEGADAILQRLRQGQDVAYLCEGDPLFYGSAMYLLERLAEHARIEIVPGVTSLTAAAAAVARPLASRNEVLKVLPAPLPDEELRAELAAGGLAAIIKVGRHFDRVRSLLIAMGRARNALVIEHATTSRQRITPLTGFAHAERPYFSVILCFGARGGAS